MQKVRESVWECLHSVFLWCAEEADLQKRLICLFCTPLCMNNTIIEHKNNVVTSYFVGLYDWSRGRQGQRAARNKRLAGSYTCHFSTSAFIWDILPKFIWRPFFTFLSILSLKADDWWWLLGPEVRSDGGKGTSDMFAVGSNGKRWQRSETSIERHG